MNKPMPKHAGRRRVIAFVIRIATAILTIHCAPGEQQASTSVNSTTLPPAPATPSAPAQVPSATTPSSTSSTSTTADSGDASCRSTGYLIAVVPIDNSASMRATAVARPSMNDITPLTDHLARCGGALAVGALTHRPTKFEECEIEPPPAPPVSVADEGDLITRAMHAAEQEEAMRCYRVALAAWRAEAQATIGALRAKVQPIVEPDNLTMSTDIVSSLVWIDAFSLQARDVPIERRRFVVLAYTYGLHDVDDRGGPDVEEQARICRHQHDRPGQLVVRHDPDDEHAGGSGVRAEAGKGGGAVSVIPEPQRRLTSTSPTSATTSRCTCGSASTPTPMVRLSRASSPNSARHARSSIRRIPTRRRAGLRCSVSPSSPGSATPAEVQTHHRPQLYGA